MIGVAFKYVICTAKCLERILVYWVYSLMIGVHSIYCLYGWMFGTPFNMFCVQLWLVCLHMFMCTAECFVRLLIYWEYNWMFGVSSIYCVYGWMIGVPSIYCVYNSIISVSPIYCVYAEWLVCLLYIVCTLNDWWAFYISCVQLNDWRAFYILCVQLNDWCAFYILCVQLNEFGVPSLYCVYNWMIGVSSIYRVYTEWLVCLIYIVCTLNDWCSFWYIERYSVMICVPSIYCL